MELGSIWNELSYLDGLLFTIWIGILYYGKCRIDHHFDNKDWK